MVVPPNVYSTTGQYGFQYSDRSYIEQLRLVWKVKGVRVPLLRAMAVGGTHPDYDASAAERARDVLAGGASERSYCWSRQIRRIVAQYTLHKLQRNRLRS
jgi:hypothetical protein